MGIHRFLSEETSFVTLDHPQSTINIFGGPSQTIAWDVNDAGDMAGAILHQDK